MSGVVLQLEVDAQTDACVGEMVQRCLRVRTPGDSAWRLFYDPIEGFTHQPGVRVVISVARTTRSQVPADASMYHYRLLEIVRRDTVNATPPPMSPR